MQQFYSWLCIILSCTNLFPYGFDFDMNRNQTLLFKIEKISKMILANV